VEGAPLTASGDNADNNRVEIFQDFDSGNAEGRKSNFRKPLIANGIAGRAIPAVVRFAIDLDC
jgi:hypothetical protein